MAGYYQDPNIPAKERSDKFVGHLPWISIPMLVAPEVAVPLWALSRVYQMHSDSGNPPIQQGDNGDYFDANGERTKLDELAGKVVGDNQWSY